MRHVETPYRVVIMTVAREGNYLPRTLDGLGPDAAATLMVGSTETGYLAPFRDDARLTVVSPSEEEYAPWRSRGVRHRASWNYWRCLEHGRRARRLLVVEDDVVFAKGWEDYLGRVVDEVERHEWDYVLSVYSPHPLAGAEGRTFVPVDERRFFGTQGVLFAGGASGSFADYLRDHGVDRLERSYDLNLGLYAAGSGTPLLATNPSLVQHVGAKTTGLGYHHTSPTFRADLGPVDGDAGHAAPPDRHDRNNRRVNITD
jgi:hypothetical protein